MASGRNYSVHVVCDRIILIFFLKRQYFDRVQCDCGDDTYVNVFSYVTVAEPRQTKCGPCVHSTRNEKINNSEKKPSSTACRILREKINHHSFKTFIDGFEVTESFVSSVILHFSSN